MMIDDSCATTGVSQDLELSGAIVIVATEWGAVHGGINSFNYNFTVALGHLFKGKIQVICLTANVDDYVKLKVKDDHIDIFTLAKVGPDNEHEVAQQAYELLKLRGVTRIDLVFGHDVITGPAAIELAKLTGGKTALFHHMSYIQYQTEKKDGQAAIEMHTAQKVALRKADFVIAVGPLLKKSAERIRKSPVPMIIPGMATIPVSTHRGDKAFRAITFGRMGGEDDPIKQGSLAVAGYGRYVKMAEDASAHRDYQFTMYGLDPSRYAVEEEALKNLMRKEAGRQITVNATIYTDDQKELWEALADSEVALMLSWHEGFGLVGWEAIMAEVPLIVSQRSGLYELLNSPDDPTGAACVSVVDIRGFDDGKPDNADVTTVAKALLKISQDWPTYHEKAKTLHKRLAEKYSWEGCAGNAINVCGFSFTKTNAEVTQDSTGSTVTKHAARATESLDADAVNRQQQMLGHREPSQRGRKPGVIKYALCAVGLLLLVVAGIAFLPLRAPRSEPKDSVQIIKCYTDSIDELTSSEASNLPRDSAKYILVVQAAPPPPSVTIKLGEGAPVDASLYIVGHPGIDTRSAHIDLKQAYVRADGFALIVGILSKQLLAEPGSDVANSYFEITTGK